MGVAAQIVGWAVLLAFAAGLLILIIRAKWPFGMSLLLSIFGCIALFFWGDNLTELIYASPTPVLQNSSGPAQGENAATALLAMESLGRAAALSELLAAVVALWFALSFLAAVASASGLRPNNSSKPMPLRGTA